MRASLFVTCLTDTFYPRSGIAVVKVLEYLGCPVDFPQEQTCCGQPMYNNGYHDEARELAQRMIRVFESSEYVVTPSGSCAAMIHDYYPGLLKNDPAYEHAGQKLVKKTYEFATFLTQVLQADLRKLNARWPGQVTYHYSCHLRGVGVPWPVIAGQHQPVLDLMSQIDGLEYVPLNKADQCCGFGGTFAAKYPDISGAMAKDKVANIQATGAPLVVSNEGGCTMNIAGACRRAGVNVAFKSLPEIIAESLGLLSRDENTKAELHVGN